MKSQNQRVERYPAGSHQNGVNGIHYTEVANNSAIGQLHIPGLKVLMYHQVVKDKTLAENSNLCVHESDFRQHLEILNHLGFTPVTFNDLELYYRGEILLPQKPVIITFDDGYLDTYSTACPLLIENGVRAVIFVLGDRKIRTNIWDRSNPQIPEASLMEDHHVKELHSNGFEIGSHSLSHANLENLNKDLARREIRQSKLILESLLGSSVRSFSYPFGAVNPFIKKITADSGYRFGSSVFSGPARFGEDLYEIRRFTINNKTTTAGFVARLKTPFEYMEWMWWKTKQKRKEYADIKH